jgi:CheY-like chemotaxis protein
MKAERSVLIVDDEKVVRDSLVEWLAETGYQVSSAEDGYEALKIINERPPEVVVLDMKMPGMDGLDVLKSIKGKDRNIGVIAITAYASVENAVDAMKLGASDYITKPFPPERLESSIGKIIPFPLPHEEVEEPAKSEPVPASQPKECVWAKAGIVSYRLCTLNFKCEKCEFAQTMIDRQADGAAREETGVNALLDKLREKSGPDRQCRYMLSGDVSFKLCPNTFQCSKCSFDQSIQDRVDQTAFRLVSVVKSKKEKVSAAS